MSETTKLKSSAGELGLDLFGVVDLRRLPGLPSEGDPVKRLGLLSLKVLAKEVCLAVCPWFKSSAAGS